MVIWPLSSRTIHGLRYSHSSKQARSVFWWHITTTASLPPTCICRGRKGPTGQIPISPLLDRFLELSHHSSVLYMENALLQAAGRRRAGCVFLCLSVQPPRNESERGKARLGQVIRLAGPARRFFIGKVKVSFGDWRTRCVVSCFSVGDRYFNCLLIVFHLLRSVCHDTRVWVQLYVHALFFSHTNLQAVCGCLGVLGHCPVGHRE